MRVGNPSLIQRERSSRNAQSTQRPQVRAARLESRTSLRYIAEVVIGDTLAALAVPATILPTWSSNPWIWSIPLSGAPAALTGPIIHALHGRWIPALASFLG